MVLLSGFIEPIQRRLVVFIEPQTAVQHYAKIELRLSVTVPGEF